MDIKDVRRDYEYGKLSRQSLVDDPMQQFQNWFDYAKEHGSHIDTTAFTLATVDANGQPHQRIVLLKEIRPEGFVFYTNYDSHKGDDIAANAQVSMHFFWASLEQQIRISGQAKPISREDSAAYFYSRPRESQLSALASQQSAPIENRKQLEQRYHELTEKYEGQQVPMPEQWGGYLITPTAFEFWQGGRYRLHDRFTYAKVDSDWVIERLQP